MLTDIRTNCCQMNHASDSNHIDPPTGDESYLSLGHPEPLDVVWRRFGEQLRRRARTRLRQYGLAGQTESMDICNDVMADLTKQNHADGVNPEDLVGYIMTAIDNQVLDTFRTLARQCRDFRRNEPGMVHEVSFVGNDTTPSQIALRRDVVERIRSLLCAVDAKAVDMMLENRDWNEIGSALGVTADAARMRVRRALDEVRQQMTGPDSPGSGSV